MCLGTPAQVISVRRENELTIARVRMGGLETDVLVAFSDTIKPGEYVIVHAGMAISKIDEKEVKELETLLHELEQALNP
ncbi:MAG: HypC/HybG/HupF family hydrogenase formation chaperone [Thermoprotei archaeon]|nr:MAG: HypC/HybG/HupF family hydrogenase formation chaperone [Thermoprotei archaeon]